MFFGYVQYSHTGWVQKFVENCNWKRESNYKYTMRVGGIHTSQLNDMRLYCSRQALQSSTVINLHNPTPEISGFCLNY